MWIRSSDSWFIDSSLCPEVESCMHEKRNAVLDQEIMCPLGFPQLSDYLLPSKAPPTSQTSLTGSLWWPAWDGWTPEPASSLYPTHLTYLQWNVHLCPDMEETPHAGLRSRRGPMQPGVLEVWTLYGVNVSMGIGKGRSLVDESPSSSLHVLVQSTDFCHSLPGQVLCAWWTQVGSCLLYLQGSWEARSMVMASQLSCPHFPSFLRPWVCTSKIAP